MHLLLSVKLWENLTPEVQAYPKVRITRLEKKGDMHLEQRSRMCVTVERETSYAKYLPAHLLTLEWRRKLKGVGCAIL